MAAQLSFGYLDTGSEPNSRTSHYLTYLSTLKIFNCWLNVFWNPVSQTSFGCQSAEAMEGPMRLLLSVKPVEFARPFTTVWNSLT